MKKLVCLFTLLLVTATGYAASSQNNNPVYKIRIRHADPELIRLLLVSGFDAFRQPEYSTIIFGSGFGNFGGGTPPSTNP